MRQPGDPTDPAALAELLKEIPPINTWPISTAPGAHPNRTNVVANNVVLLIRGKLLKRYPNAIIYVGKAKKTLHRMPIPTIESSTRATNRSDESGANVALECDHIDCKSILPPDSQYILSAPTWYPAFQIPVAVTARSASSHVQVSAADACRQLGG